MRFNFEKYNAIFETIRGFYFSLPENKKCSYFLQFINPTKVILIEKHPKFINKFATQKYYIVEFVNLPNQNELTNGCHFGLKHNHYERFKQAKVIFTYFNEIIKN